MDIPTFYSTLAESSATLIGVLAAISVAFFVFLNDQKSKIENQIVEAKFFIYDELIKLWRYFAANIYFGFMPPLFSQQYKEKYPDMTGLQLSLKIFDDFLKLTWGFKNVFSDLFFSYSPTLTAKSNKIENIKRVIGPAYLWLVQTVVEKITFRSSQDIVLKKGLFPLDPFGPNFEEWKSDFEKIYFQFMKFEMQTSGKQQEECLKSIETFFSKKKIDAKNIEKIRVELLERIEVLTKSLSLVHGKLREIDKSMLLLERIEAKKYRSLFFWIFFGLLVTTVGGVLEPLIFLAWPTRPAEGELVFHLFGLILIVLLLIMAFIRLWVCESSERANSSLNIWLSVISEEMEAQKERLNQDSFLGFASIQDFVGEAAFNKIRTEKQRRLRSYLFSVKQYNESRNRIFDKMKELLMKSELGKNFIENEGGNPGYLVPFRDFLGDEKAFDFLDGYAPAKDIELSFSDNIDERTGQYRWLIKGRPDELKKVLKKIFNQLKNEIEDFKKEKNVLIKLMELILVEIKKK